MNRCLDALGNLLAQTDALSTADAAMSYTTGDRDRLCRVGYGNSGLGGTSCNVTHDSVGNVIRQPLRVGNRRLDFFPSGNVRSILYSSSTWARPSSSMARTPT
ncbi:hypothetical protein ACN47A_18750 [Myxococcus fulvus]|uniref:hypothetical protein n=1 Tax=Myxococcus fulvus TaxID=33 RepID=UPI003B9BA1A1